MSLIRRFLTSSLAAAIIAAVAFASVAVSGAATPLSRRTFNTAAYLSGSYDSASATVKSAVDAVRSGIEGKIRTVDLQSISGITRGDIVDALNIIRAENGEYFYIDWDSCIYNDTTVTLDYYYTGDELSENIAKFDSAVDKITDGITNAMSDHDKALAIHDRLALSAAVNISTEDKNFDNYYEEKKFENYTAYGVLVGGTGFSDSYALAYMTALKSVGVDCGLVVGSGADNTWNIVLIDGEWYHVNLAKNDKSPDRYGRIAHTYFLLSDTKCTDLLGSFTSAVTADSTLYDSALMKSAVSRVSFDSDNYYYIKGKTIVSLNRSSGAETVILTVNDKWYVYTNGSFASTYYTGIYCGLELVDGKLYYNTSKSINSIGTDGVGNVVINTLDTASSLAYGLVYDGTNLTCSMQTNPDSASRNIITVSLQTKQLTGISITAEPDKKVYFQGDVLDTAGLEVEAEYSDNSSVTLSPVSDLNAYGYSVSEVNMTTAGVKTVTVTYLKNYTDTFTVTVYAYGDVNLDGAVKADDVTALEDYILGLSNLSETAATAADINKDGLINGTDLVLLRSATYIVM